MTREEFLKQEPDSNIEAVAQWMLQDFNEDEFKALRATFDKLNNTLFKSWAREMTYVELCKCLSLIETLEK